MRGLRSSLGIGLAIVASLLLLALVAELYYIFWWKKRFNTNSNLSCKLGKGLLLSLLPRSRSKSPIDQAPAPAQAPAQPSPSPSPLPDDPLHLSSKDHALLKASDVEAIDAELMRLHSLSGPPRFLFTIKEETREDLESDDGRSRGGRSLGDLLHCTPETPFLTPLSSPPFLGITVQNLVTLDSFKKLGLNPLFESSSSPPPKFKFLKDAEDKLQRRIGLLEGSRAGGNGDTDTLPLTSALSSIQTEEAKLIN